MNRALVFIISLMLCVSVYAMRCGSALINEGDTIGQAVSICGQPNEQTANSATYINKDGDGMNYFIHADNNGIIDNITFSRGSKD